MILVFSALSSIGGTAIFEKEFKVMGIPVKLQVFEGPLDLLLHLIDKNKVNIYDIPIAIIAQQYMEYVDKMDKEDLNVVSEFLVMAATLLDIKSRMLLPKEVSEDGEENDPRQELVEQLLQYKMFKYASMELKDRQVDAGRSLYKPATIPSEVESYKPPVDLEELIGDITLSKLNNIFREVMKRQEDKIDPIRSRFGKIKKEEVSLEDRLLEVKAFLMKNRNFSFRQLLLDRPGKISTIVTFLVVLELIKTGFLTVEQDGIMSDIRLTVKNDPAMIGNINETDEIYGSENKTNVNETEN